MSGRGNLGVHLYQAARRRDCEGRPGGAGDAWTSTALEPDSKLIVSYLVGSRDAEYAMQFMDDLAARLANRA